MVQLLFRNDTEADCSTQELIDWDAAIIEEDREILESTDPDAIVDINRKIEMHMPSDRPGMLMRRRVGSAAVASAPDTKRKPEQKMSKPQSAIFGRKIPQYRAIGQPP